MYETIAKKADISDNIQLAPLGDIGEPLKEGDGK